VEGTGAGGVDGKAGLLELRQIADAAVDDRASKAAREHRCAHQAAHTGDVGSILYLHDVDRAGAAGVDGLEHASQRVGVVVFLFYEFDRDRGSGEFRREDRLHAMGHVTLLVEQLFDGVGDGGGLHVAVGVEHGGRIGKVLGCSLRRVCVDDVGDGEKRGTDDGDCNGDAYSARRQNRVQFQ